jgi:hypothetical protein
LEQQTTGYGHPVTEDRTDRVTGPAEDHGQGVQIGFGKVDHVKGPARR